MAAFKLTIDLEPDVIERAKKYASERHISLQELVQDYLDNITRQENPEEDEPKISGWVKQLVIVDKPTLDFDYKSEYRKRIEKKVGK